MNVRSPAKLLPLLLLPLTSGFCCCVPLPVVLVLFVGLSSQARAERPHTTAVAVAALVGVVLNVALGLA